MSEILRRRRRREAEIERASHVIFESESSISSAPQINGKLRIRAGASIINAAGGFKTAEIVGQIRAKHPDIPIIASGGETDESLLATIKAGTNAIVWTPPSNGEVFRAIMDAYREGDAHP